MKKFSVVFTGNFLFPQGYAGTKRIKNLIDCWVKEGVQCYVVVFNNSKFGKMDNGVEYGGVYSTNTVLTKLLLYPFAFFRGVQFLMKYKSSGLDYLYVYSGVTLENFPLVLAGRILGYKIILDVVEDFSLHNENVSRIRSIKIFTLKFFEKFVSRYADIIIVISTYLEGKFRKELKTKLPIYLYPVTANPNIFEKRESISGNIRILYSGTFGKKDGFDYLLAAFRRLFNEERKIELIITGEVKKSVLEKTLDIADKVSFTGYLNDLQYFETLKQADILVMPRINTPYANAGFPFKLGEYLATGNAVVATMVSDINKYLKNNQDSIIVEPSNSDALYKAILSLLENERLRFEIGRNGLLTFNRYFEAHATSKELLGFLTRNSDFN